MNSARRSPPPGKDFITLGYIDYTIAKFEPPINIGYAMSANPILTNITFDSRQFRENYPREYEALQAINGVLSAVIATFFDGNQPRIVGGTASYGSLRYRGGKLEVDAKWLAYAVAGYMAISSYPDFRQGLGLLTDDVTHAVEHVGEALKLADTKFTPRPPEDIGREPKMLIINRP
ncbi:MULTISPECIES: hypothetical protein [Agrobacterium]|uniref:hypothetical protein n=1 Tax=Agrobacterium TaxID=357 RepID=UPI000DD396F0|nr:MULTISPECIES: hypothetical protein [Agrobacterium]MBO9108227.1 hypothetical protein [Agrobacterium sp. S2/73]NTA15455.1 hypothetical protein [Agrobacterium tumefaciens]NTA80386.1 hypothetical protein [Agrobacterium tumefaciens]QXZ71186.1 hypothetical protein J5276_08680 [Agrobacterium sp. S7/73]WCK71687.1 hypothetical protein G6L96_004240 [Agrobacterium tumefaciens]